MLLFLCCAGSHLSVLCPEIIAHTPLGMYVFRVTWTRLDFLTQTSYVNIHGTYISRFRSLVAPHKRQKALSGIDFVGIADQKFQKIKLLGRQIDFFFTNEYPAAFPIKL